MENENSEQIKSEISAREARRKRILENSNNRLSKITGRVHNEEVPKVEEINTDNGLYPDPEIERDIFEGPSTLNSLNLNNPNQDVFELLKTLQNEKSSNKSENLNSQQQVLQQSPFSRFIRSKYPIIIIALIVYTLFALNIDKIIGSSVFSLFILWEIFEFTMTAFILKEPIQQNQFTVLISMFLGLNSHSIHIIMKILGLFNKILRDIATFLFTFVYVHLIFNLIMGERMSDILDKDFNKLLSKDEM